MKYDLSIIIPSRNEEFLTNTIDDIVKNKRGKTQVIVGLDGQWPTTPIKNHPDVVVLFFPESIGQRAISNRCARVSDSKYLMKVDAHCAFDEGFDVKMLEKMEDDITMVPVMRNLHAFDWVCKNGHRRYQSPSGPCKECGEPTDKDIKWIAKKNPQSTAYRFDNTMHFQYWGEFGKKQEGELTETMSIQGSCFLVTKDKWFELDLCSESFNSWGQQGVEVACKTWLSGGRVLVNRNTWYAHMFRTQGGDFSFPYKNPESKVQENRELSRELFQKDKWDKAKYPFQWLIDKFNPPDWQTRGILYYTNNKLNMKLARGCRKQLEKSGLPITSISTKPLDFGKNIVYGDYGETAGERIARKVLKGLESMTEDIVYFAESDVLYHPDHFKFIPKDRETWYYNGNYWFLRQSDGFAIHYNVSPLSGLVVHRESAIKHFRERIKYIEENGFSLKIGYEPFTHKRIKWDYWCPFEIFMPEHPNVDVTHGSNASWKRWNIKDFRNKPTFWEETTDFNVPSWDLIWLQ